MRKRWSPFGPLFKLVQTLPQLCWTPGTAPSVKFFVCSPLRDGALVTLVPYALRSSGGIVLSFGAVFLRASIPCLASLVPVLAPGAPIVLGRSPNPWSTPGLKWHH